MIHKEICVSCARGMKVIFNGAWALEFTNEEKTEPYRLWRVDLSECPECGTRIVARFADKPYMYHHEEGFAEQVTKARQEGERCDTFFEVY